MPSADMGQKSDAPPQMDVQEWCILQPTVHNPSPLSTNPAPERITPGPMPRPDNAGAQITYPTVLQAPSLRANVINPIVTGYLIAGVPEGTLLLGWRQRCTHCVREPAASWKAGKDSFGQGKA